MDPIVKDFEDDLNKILNQVELIEALGSFFACEAPYIGDDSFPFLENAKSLQEKLKATHASLPIARGTLILYTCGRFEAMARTMFEDLCQRLVQNAKEYKRLPNKMQENLTTFTAKVISEPRRYGHAEGGVRTFVATLAQNLQPNAAISRVNHECLSITEANMRADVLSELFARVGITELWKQLSQQASIKTFFKETDSISVESKAKKKLNDLMELRNKIAHPSGSIEWPSAEHLRQNLEFLKLLTRVLGELMAMYEHTLCKAQESQAQLVQPMPA